MRRVACPRLLTVTLSIMPSRMNVVGSTADAVTVTVLTPVPASVVSEKKLGAAVGSTAADVPM